MVDMNVEINRLNTFHSWPINAPVDAERLARCAFFATGNYLETQCNWCNKKISDWQYGDQIMVRHRRLDPLCPFVVNPTNSGNVPITATTTTSSSSNVNSNNSTLGAVPSPPPPPTSSQLQQQDDVGRGDLKDEMFRLASFKNWPNRHISPQSLVKAGFYYLNKFDRVRCAWCSGVLENWTKEDNAFVEHKRHFPHCQRVQLGPLVEMRNDDLGIQQVTPARHPKYASPDARIRTFIRWPIGDIQKPEILAQAGFYYQDVDDHVRCFHCNGGLRSWQKEDDPWFEHARWFPNCPFLRLAKGIQYINQVQEKGRQPDGKQDNTSGNNFQSIMTIDEAMSTEPVRRALEMGLNVGRIRSATRQHLEIFGKPFETIEHLVETVLEGQVDEEGEEEDANEHSSSLFQEVSRILDNIRFQRNELIDTSTSDDDEPPTAVNTIGLNDVAILPIRNNGIENNESSQTTTTNVAYNNSPNVVPDKSDNDSSRRNCEDGGTVSNSSGTGTSCSADMQTSVPSNVQKQISVEDEDRKIKDVLLCKVCMDDEVGVVLLPCGHFVICFQCASGLEMCPLCRGTINGWVRTFLS